MSRRTFFGKMALILMISQLFFFFLAPTKVSAAIMSDFDLRYVVEGGRLKIVLLEKGAPTPRQRVGEWVRSGSASGPNGSVTTFRAGTIRDAFKQELSTNGDGTTFQEIRVSNSSPGSAYYTSDRNNTQRVEESGRFTRYGTCGQQQFTDTRQYDLCVDSNAPQFTGDEANYTGGDGNANDAEEPPELEDGCDVQLNSPLSWILCPIILAAQSAVDSYYNAIDNALNFSIEGDRDEADLKGAWDAIRNIANVLFVIAFLFIIISQTLVGKL